MNEHCSLVIHPDGEIDHLHETDSVEYVHRQSPGLQPIKMVVTVDEGERDLAIVFSPDGALPLNDKGRETIARVFGFYIIIPGDVVIEGLTPEEFASATA